MTGLGETPMLRGFTTLLRLADVPPARWVATTIGLSLVLALIDMVGLAAMVPLTRLLSDPNTSSPAVGLVADLFRTREPGVLIPLFALCVAVLFVVSSVLMIAFRWWQLGRTNRIAARAATELLRRYAGESYAAHRARNTADIYRNVTEMTAFSGNALLNAITVVSDALTLAGIAVVLFVTSPLVTVFTIALFAAAMVVFQWVFRARQLRVGDDLAAASLDAWSHITPVLEGFREARLSATADRFVDGYGGARDRSAEANRAFSILAEMPKYLLQVVFVLAIAGMAAILFATGSADSALTVLAVFAAAALRGLPIMTRVSANVSSVRSGTVSLGILTNAVASLGSPPRREPASARRPLDYRGDIELRGVGFRYPDSPEPVLKGLCLTIEEHRTTAIVGSSGAGKSTALDLVLGLLRPTSGDILCGGISIFEDPAGWYERLGVVPQDVFLLNDTLRANIVFGVPEGPDVDARLREVLRMAQLEGLVDLLPEGLATIVGERGTRLSGGQRQRVGLARAMFRRPRVLVLDEATSALDNETEHEITRTLRELHGRMTVIIVAHRLSTVRHADSLVFLADGRVDAQGTFEQVRASTPSFARLVELGELP
ncbi:hypothetical protein LK09_00450 [Microbacterium mangrovi]|uniref:ABC transporter ATP-binding protein n=1 Tax=Microbacterium mangrovi TaxID=1348253 RepID=A0A0B2A8I5_9MICO|nr:ABC transporter ATP-binding protein [Microbacterium mangrovi]KHK99848.1 hypothetical protein LK09_00450 [Microbacterium mangrovi]